MDLLIEAINEISDTIIKAFEVNAFQIIPTILTILFSIGALWFANKANKFSEKANESSKKATELSNKAFTFEKKILKQNRFEQLMNEYRSDKMYKSIKKLYDEYKINKERLEKKGLPDSIIERFIFEAMIKDEYTNLSRRYVTQYFSMIATYYIRNKIDHNEVKYFWGKNNLSIIIELLIPLEKIYAMEIYGQDEKTIDQNMTLNTLEKFYNKIISIKKV